MCKFFVVKYFFKKVFINFLKGRLNKTSFKNNFKYYGSKKESKESSKEKDSFKKEASLVRYL